MTNAAIAWRLIRRVLLFAVLGAIIGGVTGVVEGVGFGALCAGLLFWVEPVTMVGGLMGHAANGAGFGGFFGICLGAFVGALAFGILGGILGPLLGWRDIWRRCTGRAVFWPLLGATVGGLSGVMAVAGWNMVHGADGIIAMLKNAFPLGGGFFFGSLAGFGVAMFAGILSSGMSVARAPK